MIEVQTQPATKIPRDAKPSEIVRSWPKERSCAGVLSSQCADGRTAYCAVGILAEEGGFDWSYSGDNISGPYTTLAAARFVAKTYDVPFDVIDKIVGINDREGKDVAADWLELCGY